MSEATPETIISELHSEAKLETETIFDEEAAAENLFESVRTKRTQKKSQKLLEAEETERNIKSLKVETEIDIEDYSEIEAIEEHVKPKPKKTKISKVKTVNLEDQTNENPWDIKSIYELQYFNCPKCDYKNHSKQEFIQHAYVNHPEAIEKFNNIEDGSLFDVDCPWNETEFVDIKEELMDINDDDSSNVDPNKSHQCHFCSENFKSTMLYHEHLQTHRVCIHVLY